MKNILNSILAGLILISIPAFSGCEEGLSTNSSDTSGENQDTGFSFSDMYNRMNAMQKEIEKLHAVNNEQQVIINSITGGSGVSINSLVARVGDIESYIGDIAASPASTVSTRIQELETKVGSFTSSGLDSRIDTLEGRVGTFTSSGLDSRIDILEGRVGTFASSGLDGRIDILEGRVGTFTSSGLDSRIDILEGRVGTFTSSGLDSRIDILEGRVGTFTSSGLDGRIDSLENTLGGVTRGLDAEGYDTITFTGMNV
ncbi:MAG: hypothetical protein GY754_41325, partial [bacterium]|nr:hypothetical protein [bacterium]